jgi:prepilin-type N-terminal cleavage/methylation domain-containing protein
MKWGRAAGFTLIELAIVLVILGLIVSGGLTVGASFASKSATVQNAKAVQRIKDALQTYVVQNGCLPCPADGSLNRDTSGGNAGISLTTGGVYVTTTVHCTATACIATNGVVPYKTLGIGPQDYLDAWGNQFTYQVSAGLNGTGAMLRLSDGSYPDGALTVNDISGTTTLYTITTAAAYVIVSHGEDGSFAWQTRGARRGDRYGQTGGANGQFENADYDTTFAASEINSTNTTAHFDDIVAFETAGMMVLKCGSGSCDNP